MDYDKLFKIIFGKRITVVYDALLTHNDRPFHMKFYWDKEEIEVNTPKAIGMVGLDVLIPNNVVSIARKIYDIELKRIKEED